MKIEDVMRKVSELLDSKSKEELIQRIETATDSEKQLGKMAPLETSWSEFSSSLPLEIYDSAGICGCGRHLPCREHDAKP